MNMFVCISDGNGFPGIFVICVSVFFLVLLAK